MIVTLKFGELFFRSLKCYESLVLLPHNAGLSWPWVEKERTTLPRRRGATTQTDAAQRQYARRVYTAGRGCEM